MGNINNTPEKPKIIKKRSKKKPLSIILVGDMKVGKTSFMRRLSDNTVTDNYVPTIGIAFDNYEYKDDKILIWDTSGDSKFNTITYSYYKNAKGYLVFYDVTNKESFENVEKWIKSIEDYSNNLDNAALILVGTKMDDEEHKQVSTFEGKELAESYNIPFIEISAKTNKNIDICIKLIMETIYKKAGIQILTDTYFIK